MVFENILRGRRGEVLARKFLRKKGYRILEKNYTSRYGEIDIVASHDGVLVFVEVKTRHGDSFGAPQESVGYHKQRHITRAASNYLREKKISGLEVRFDVVSIVFKGSDYEIDLIRNAFDAVE